MSSNDKADVVVDKATENSDGADAKAEVKGVKRPAEEKDADVKKAKRDEANGEDEVDDEEEVDGEEEEEEVPGDEEEEDEEDEGDDGPEDAEEEEDDDA